MNRRSLCILFAVAFCLGCLFQYSRMDGFLHLGARYNVERAMSAILSNDAAEAYPRDAFLIIYDPADVASMYARHNMERLLTEKRMAYMSRPLYDANAIGGDWRGIALTTGRLDAVAQLSEVLGYVEQGGTLLVLQKIELKDAAAFPQERLNAFGVERIGENVTVGGIRIRTDFLLGGKDFSMPDTPAFMTSGNAVALTPSATVHIESADGTPLLWETCCGEGRIYTYNAVTRDDKTDRGVYMALLSHCGEDAIYPVVGVKLFILDDFPAPVPEGNFDGIYNELGVDTKTFYREIWWPFVRQLARDYDIKYTGAIIETYGAQTKAPFAPLGGRDALIIYGRELLKMGGELGLHGYNHQSLAPPGYGAEKLGYTPWESPEDMDGALTELLRYVTSAYPDYTFRFYVPPSNVLSPEGKAALRRNLPDLEVIGSLFDGPSNEPAYIQDFEYKDGLYELPRISSGHTDASNRMLYQEISALNYIGVFSHFIHPDELFYESSEGLTWHAMKTGMDAFMAEIHTRFPWLTASTVSESLPSFRNYFDMDYRVERTDGSMTICAWGFSGELRFILRTRRGIESVDGGTAEAVGDGAYLVRMTSAKTEIHWKEGT